MSASLSLNALCVIAARLGVPCLNVLLVAALARIGGAELLGQYTLLVTLFILSENLKSCGLTTLLTREVAASPQIGVGYYPSVVRIGLLGSLPAAFVLIAVLAISHVPQRVMLSGGLLSVALIPSSFILAGDALLLGLSRAHCSMLVTISENLTRLVASLAVLLFLHGGLIGLALTYLFTRLLAARVQRRLLLRYTDSIPTHDVVVTRQMLAGAAPYFVVFVAPLLLFKLDIVLLGAFRGETAVGVYSAAMRLTAIWFVIPDGLMTATLVRLAHLSAANRIAEFRALVERTVRFLNIVMIPLGIGTVLCGHLIVRGLFGEKLANSLPLLDILNWTIVPYALCRALGDTLVAVNRQSALARIILLTLAISFGWYILLIRYAAETGAAWAFLLSTLTLSSLTAWEVVRNRKIVPATTFWRGLGPSVLGLTGTLAIRHGFVTVALTIFFLGALIVIRDLRTEWNLHCEKKSLTHLPLSQLALDSAK